MLLSASPFATLVRRRGPVLVGLADLSFRITFCYRLSLLQPEVTAYAMFSIEGRLRYNPYNRSVATWSFLCLLQHYQFQDFNRFEVTGVLEKCVLNCIKSIQLLNANHLHFPGNSMEKQATTSAQANRLFKPNMLDKYPTQSSKWLTTYPFNAHPPPTSPSLPTP